MSGRGLSQKCPPVVPGPLRQHHLGLLRLLAHSRPPSTPPVTISRHWKGQYAPAFLPASSHPQTHPSIKNGKTRNIHNGDQENGVARNAQCSCSPRIPRATLTVTGCGKETAALGPADGVSAPQRRPSGSWQAGLPGDEARGGLGR